jgi:hypothetical protein
LGSAKVFHEKLDAKEQYTAKYNAENEMFGRGSDHFGRL